jgi:aspartyl-tRNA(Asn)/glutamyl-tRNA(Gln) amidotransferase subunit C
MSEAVALQKDLDQILGYVEQLGAVDVEGVEPTYQVHSLHTVVRSDEIKDYGVARDDLLKNAPEKEDNLIVVPKVIE